MVESNSDRAEGSCKLSRYLVQEGQRRRTVYVGHTLQEMLQRDPHAWCVRDPEFNCN